MPTSIRLSAETEKRFSFLLAQHTGRAKAYYLREIIEQGIEQLEDYCLAADVLKRVRTEEEGVHASWDLSLDLGMDG